MFQVELKKVRLEAVLKFSLLTLFLMYSHAFAEPAQGEDPNLAFKPGGARVLDCSGADCNTSLLQMKETASDAKKIQTYLLKDSKD